MSISLQEIRNGYEEENLDYLSDVMSNWFLDKIKEYSEEDRRSLKNQILREEKQNRFLKGRFFYFQYFPTERGNSYYESFDRSPLILYLGKKEKIIHGMNIHYLPTFRKIFFMNKLFRYLGGDYNAESSSNKIFLTYDMMKQRDSFVEERVIYRKYYINRIRNIKIVPVKHIKLFSLLGNTSNFLYSEKSIQNTTLLNLRAQRNKKSKSRERKI